MRGPRDREPLPTLRLAAAAGLLAAAGTGAAGTPAVARAQEAPRPALPADTDTVALDTIRADTVPVRLRLSDTATSDIVSAEELEERRRGLGGGEFPERDSVFDRLMERSGVRAVEYRGEDVELDVDREAVQLRGSAQANYTASVLEADSIAYQAAAQFISARGGIRLVGADRREVTSDSTLFYDVSRLRGTIMDARTAFAEQGAEWYVRGTATPRGQREVFVEAGSFTSCELEAPHYYFKAGQIKVVSQDIIAAWPIVLYIHNVPIAWLPFFAQDIRPGRRSGFLPPRFGVSDVIQTSSGRTGRSVTDFGYYFAINRFLDAQATIDWFAGSFTRLNGAFRYRFLKSFVQGNLLASYSYGSEGRSLEVRGEHRQELSPDTDVRANVAYVQNTRLFQDRTFDPELQTQTIDSDVGLNHRFPFGRLSVSGRRRQFQGEQGRVELTLPQMNMTFSPVTLFPAPRNRAGPFNNLTLSGGTNFSRRSRTQEGSDDVTDTNGAVNSSLRLGRFGVSGGVTFDDQRTTPFDEETEEDGDPFSETRIAWNSSANFQVDLMGSTTLRPGVQVSGSQFRSPGTEGDFVTTPTRMDLNASLTTDLYGFYPGFAAFSRVRHKISPSFNWRYSPEVSVADSLLEIPGFPAASAQARHTLSVTLNQTFEAKVRPEREPEEVEGAGPPAEEAEPEAGPEEGPEEGEDPPEEAGPGAGAEREVGAEQTFPDPRQEAEAGPGGAPPIGSARRAPQERNVVLLAISSSSLDFDFEQEEGPLLVTDRFRNNISSDLLRGLDLRVTYDLFEGTGAERAFSPFLSELSGSFSLRSGLGLGQIFGLGGDRGAARGRPRIPRGIDSRYRLRGFEDEPFEDEMGPPTGAGPWDLSLSYSLSRVREEEAGEKSQSISGTLSLQPTPNWRFRWSTQYNFTRGEFGRHLVTLDRDLHRWIANFSFAKSPNGNFLFQVAVSLKDAPDLRIDYDQQSLTGR